jgi:hypothetical protein
MEIQQLFSDILGNDNQKRQHAEHLIEEHAQQNPIAVLDQLLQNLSS